MPQKDLMKLGTNWILIIAALFVAPLARGDRIDKDSLYNRLEQQAKAIELKNDPFTAIPIANEENLQSSAVLTGIIWDKDNPMAIIGDSVVKIGERLGNKKVIDIKRDRVIFSDGEALSEIRLEH
jgi:hypothetical protein